MDGSSTRRIAEVVNKCPTQALIWKNNEDLSEAELLAQREVKKEEETPRTLGKPIPKKEPRIKPVNVRIMKDGPIVVEGKFRILGKDDLELKPSLMTSFCRCGNSRDMPYCDGAHRKTGFTDEFT